jgi:hypothetical protein
MQSHDDRDGNDTLAAFWKEAQGLTARGENLITAGAPNEVAVAEWTRGGFLIRQLPPDPLALRISVGEAHDKRIGESAYLVFRGDRSTITTLLRRALAALDGAA